MLTTRNLFAYGYAHFWELSACGGHSSSGDTL